MSAPATPADVFCQSGGGRTPPLAYDARAMKTTKAIERDTVSMYFVHAAVARLPAATRAAVLLRAGIDAVAVAAFAATAGQAAPARSGSSAAPGSSAPLDSSGPPGSSGPPAASAPPGSSGPPDAADARVPADRFAALWLAVAQALDDEFFGLDSRRMKVGSFALLCRAVLPSATLERALRACVRGFRLFLDDLDADIHTAAGRTVVTLDNRIADPAARRFADETWLVLLRGLMCWLAGRRLPVELNLAGAAPPHAAEYRVMFGPSIGFGAERTRLSFDAAALAGPVVQTEATLKRFLRDAPQSVFLRYRNVDGWAARVRRRLRPGLERLASDPWPTLDALAADFGIAPSTLRRRLDAEGASYQAIKDGLRRDRAIERLAAGDATVAQIAESLGFQEASAFHRAFRKWTGVQPGAYRGRAAGGVDDGAAGG